MRPGITARKETCPSSPHLRPIRTWRNARKRSSPRNSAAEVLLCYTGVLLAAGNVKDHAHQACLRLLRHAENTPMPMMRGRDRDRTPADPGACWRRGSVRRTRRTVPAELLRRAGAVQQEAADFAGGHLTDHSGVQLRGSAALISPVVRIALA